MEKKSKVDPKGHIMLSREEMKNVCGGLKMEMILNFMLCGAGYFFCKELTEPTCIKALL